MTPSNITAKLQDAISTCHQLANSAAFMVEFANCKTARQRRVLLMSKCDFETYQPERTAAAYGAYSHAHAASPVISPATAKVQGKGLLQIFVKYTSETQPETTTMTASSITVTTQVNINGVNADTYSDATLFVMIQQQEAEIKNLQSITNKPQSLLAEIKARQAGIDSLVAFMDEREAKRNPQPVVGTSSGIKSDTINAGTIDPAGPQPAKPTGPDLQSLQGSI